MNNLIPLTSAIDSLFAQPTSPAINRAQSSDILESDDNYLVRISLPGVKKDDVTIELKNDTLTVTASGEQSIPEGYRSLSGNYQNKIAFSRNYKMGSGVNPSGIDAKFENGVLLITISKSEESVAKQIKIS